MDYGHLVDIGRKLVDAKVSTPLTERGALGVEGRHPVAPCLARPWRWGRRCGLLPAALKGQGSAAPGGGRNLRRPMRASVLLLAGCANPP